MTQGDVPIGSVFVVDGKRYQRIGMSSIIEVDAFNSPIGQAKALIPESAITFIE